MGNKNALFYQKKARIDWQQFCTKKAKSIPGFEPGLFKQNANALPLAPPPQPTFGNIFLLNTFQSKRKNTSRSMRGSSASL